MKISKSSSLRFTLAAIFLCLITSCSDNNNSSGNADEPELGEPGPPIAACTITQSQVLSPTLLTEVPNGLNSVLCDFNVMAWETFLYLVGPVSENSNQRRFEVTEDYPNYLGSGNDSCSAELLGSELVTLGTSATDPTVGPDSEAGTGIEVYSVDAAQEGDDNIVLYNIRFSRDLCENTGSANLPDNLIEIKTAWRFLPYSINQDDYFTMNVMLETDDLVTLGLIGFHLAQTTPLHPEMIWTTWEHIDNSPDCVPTASSPVLPERGWTMMTETCADCIGPDGLSDCTAQCTNSEDIYINKGREGPTDGSTPPSLADSTNVCRVFPQGTHDGDNQSDQNRANINSLNEQIIGEDGYLANIDPTDPQTIWRNYQMVGGIWFNTDTEGNVVPTEQRGSIQLANSVMETTFQGIFTPGPGGSTSTGGINCFICHTAQDYTQTRASGLSHIASHVNGN